MQYDSNNISLETDNGLEQKPDVLPQLCVFLTNMPGRISKIAQLEWHEDPHLAQGGSPASSDPSYYFLSVRALL